jgi:glycosyltransferase involved in cell wall biosynthesis
MDFHLHKTTQLEILRAFAQNGNRVFLIASYSCEKVTSRPWGVRLVLVPLRFVSFFSTIIYTLVLLLFLPWLLLHLKPDYVLVEPLTAIHGILSRFLLPRSKKVVLDVRSGPVGKAGFAMRLSFESAMHMARRFNGITAITPLLKKDICSKYGFDSEFVGVWSSGVSTSVFNPDRYDASRMRRKFGLESKFVVLYHGTLGGPRTPRGIIETIKAMGELRSGYPQITLFLLGNSTFPPGTIEHLIQKLNVQDTVIVHDSVGYEEVPKYIAMCDVGIVPLPNFSFWRHQCPLSLLEYLAMGKPVVVTDIPASRGILEDCDCGIYVPSTHPMKIAKGIAYAYDNKESLSRWGNKGRLIVKNRYEWDKVTGTLESFLSKL